MPTESHRIPRLVIAAPQGRSGKTTTALGLCAALRLRGLRVQPFKKGPDYIDASWLSEAAGQACRSLDPFFYETPKSLREAFLQPARQAGLSLIEGNHGLFDSFDAEGTGSTAAVARILKAPILLVVNTVRTGRSAAAIVLGCQNFEPDTPIAGVILNNVAQSRHEGRLRSAIEAHCGIPVVGALPREAALTIPDRHLGLVPRSEEEGYVPAIEACRQAAEKYLNLEVILEIASSAPELSEEILENKPESEPQPPKTRIGILRDRAFTFYYPENLEALQSAGAELVPINAFEDRKLPPVDALYLGGGFPEVFMEKLSANVALRMAIRYAAEAGLPMYAECGGMMYLARRIHWGERSAEMAGVLPCEIEMTDRPQGHGYVSLRVDGENPFFPIGSVLRGHEFHNSRLIPSTEGGLTTAYSLQRGRGVGGGRDGLVYKNVLACYTHLHVGGAEDWARRLVERARLQHEESARP